MSEAAGAGESAERFRYAYLAALRGAAAVLAATEGKARAAASRRPRSRSAWVLMARAAPEFAAWADYFAEHSALRASVEAGVTRAIADVDADRFYGEVGRFLTAVEDSCPRWARIAVIEVSPHSVRWVIPDTLTESWVAASQIVMDSSTTRRWSRW
ncbi:SAV_6107 family HEPN domain-containing protein [Prescottella defluvii]|nr:SAV_6107 family HEPN domain-containing protein [Prescottella defluvii]